MAESLPRLGGRRAYIERSERRHGRGHDHHRRTGNSPGQHLDQLYETPVKRPAWNHRRNRQENGWVCPRGHRGNEQTDVLEGRQNLVRSRHHVCRQICEARGPKGGRNLRRKTQGGAPGDRRHAEKGSGASGTYLSGGAAVHLARIHRASHRVGPPMRSFWDASISICIPFI